MDEAKTLRWLHFSDIHVGMGEQVRLWPRSSTVLLDDLETAHRKTDGFDLLVFSGDLAFKGSADEFDRFDQILERILGRLGDLGPRPPVVTVPGNHDLVRPDGALPTPVALSQFWNLPTVRERMWDASQPYLEFLSGVFENYSAWRDTAVARGIHLVPAMEGLLPGDASYILEGANARTGIVALNSTWLQLGAGDYDKGLHVDARQLLAVTGGDADRWVRDNAVNLIVTHQPATWLHATSPESWDNDLNPAGRFDAHLFGHMHEPEVTSTSRGGGPARRNLQAASLFGLETYGEGHKRIQGYSANRIVATGADRVLTTWPRRLVEVTDGRQKLAPDTGQDIDEDTGALTMPPYRVERHAIVAGAERPAGAAPTPPPRLASSSFDLAAIRLPLGDAKAHAKVRRVEQEACAAALKDARAAWLAADWGMGEAGFVATVCGLMGIPREKVFGVDFEGYAGTEDFFDELRTRLGATFQEVCEAIAEAGPCVLVLDDIDVEPADEAAVEALVKPVRDFAADALILIRSRRRPRAATLKVVELKALDEADLATYARDSEAGGEHYAKPDIVSSLYRHTDGVPSRLDEALRDLEIVSIGDLLAANPDYGDDAAAAVTSAPPALVATVGELARSEDRAEERAYNLLLALSALPKGEQLSRITRFLGPHPFYPAHARALLDRTLIDTVTITTLEGMPGDVTQKALVVPRPVREYVRSIMDEQTARSLDRKALDLYFGDDWASGDIARSPTGRRASNALCDGYELQNAAALILRGTRRALIDDAGVELGAHVRLASSFVETLITGDHFRSAAALCNDMIRLLEETGRHAGEINVLRYESARSLRMAERLDDARSAFEQLDLARLSKEQRQSAELGLALLLRRQGEGADAVAAANRAIAIDRRSNLALQAKTIIASEIEDPIRRAAELRRLLTAARKADSTTIANNILLTLAALERDQHAAATMLKEVMSAPLAKRDFYNGVRAILDLAARKPAGSRLADADRARLIDAYHFLYNERLDKLFDRCHEALWNEFEIAGEIENLLNLFRHSSFIWRLGGREEMEARYLGRLARIVREVLALDAVQTSRDGAYFIVRVSVVMTELDFRPGAA
ncbi:hypothetical protein ASE95_15365 [Sphingomonas sp. Leaf231]|uniref:metallophosphoesterase family protein n=1 Tax=Sphingomonas sp. Leaf231 TaxID=1736301 RepID=UPI0006FAEABF|nr:metallophosphoesterase [Sphingomonas sp. Leaf231]KQN90082.1 hypothetical protein ASE95_15365 [Sphingomonas sp. Leaf231]